MILQQLRCCGVLEVVRIAKAGYPTRYPHKTFVNRYVELMPRREVRSMETFALCEALLKHFRVPEEMWQLGSTKIFFKAGVLGAMEDLRRRTRGATLTIQAAVRMHLARKRFLALRSAATTIAAVRRGLVARRDYAVAIREHRAARTIQTGTRGMLARREAARRRAATTTIQLAVKRWQLRRRCEAREADMRQALEFAQNRALRAQVRPLLCSCSAYGVCAAGVAPPVQARTEAASSIGRVLASCACLEGLAVLRLTLLSARMTGLIVVPRAAAVVRFTALVCCELARCTTGCIQRRRPSPWTPGVLGVQGYVILMLFAAWS
jgi:Myosin head (motor domain)/IQ calmodulin-binding motif